MMVVFPSNMFTVAVSCFCGKRLRGYFKNTKQTSESERVPLKSWGGGRRAAARALADKENWPEDLNVETVAAAVQVKAAEMWTQWHDRESQRQENL